MMNYKNMFKLLCSALCLLLLGLASLVGAEMYEWKSVAIGGGGFVSAVIPSKTEQGLVYARTDVGGAYRWDKNKSLWTPLLDWVSDEETGILGVESLALDPQISSRLYMLAGISYFNGGKTYLLRSDDYGKTFSITNVTRQFKAHGNGMGRQTGEKLQVDPVNSNLLYVGTRWNGLFKSTDAGVSWARMSSLNITSTPNENGISFVLIDPKSAANGVSQRIFVGISRFPSVGANFYRSDDAGKNFIAVEGAPKGLMPQRAIFSGDGNLYITYANGAGPHSHWVQAEPMDKGQLWKFNIASGSWTNLTPKGFTRSLAGISVDPKNPQRLILSSVNTYLPQGTAWGDRLFITNDGGASWTDIIARGFSMDNNGVSWINGHSIHWAGSFEFDPFDAKRAWVTSGNGIFKTNNIDAIPTRWIFDVSGIEETVPLNMVSTTDGPLLTVIADYDGFLHNNPSQYAPIHTPRMGTTTGLAVAARMTNKVARSGGGDSPAIYISSDSGTSWKKAVSAKGKNGQLAFSADGKVLLHSPEGSATSYRSANSGKRWSAVSGLNVTSARIVADPINSNKFYALNGKTMMVSTDAGVSFSPAGSLKSPGSKVMSLAPDREGDIWVALHSGGLARSTDSGGSFSTLKTVTYAAAVGFGKAAPGAAYPAIYIWGTVKGVRGVHRSTDTGATWVRINDDDHEYGGPGNGQFILGDMNLFGRVFMSTAGRGVVYGEPAE
jgi:xyloglucan-specific exo-beta-1,4-glucanase